MSEADILKKYGIKNAEEEILAKYGIMDEGAPKEILEYEPSPLTAAMRATGDTLTLGHHDEAMGALEGSPLGAIKALMGKGSDDEDVQKYQKSRNRMRALMDKEREKNPVTSGVTSLVASIAGPGKIVGGLKKGRVALSALMGLGAGEGMSRGELADKEYKKVAIPAAVGAVVGGATQYGGDKLGDYLKKRAAERLAAKAAGEAAEGSGKVMAEGIEMVDESQTPGAVQSVIEDGKKILSQASPRPNVDEVESSAKALAGDKFNVPGYMRTADETTQNMASTVLKSPTIAGSLERKGLKPLTDAVDEFGQTVGSRAGTQSAVQTGQNVRKGISDEFAARLAPAEKIYDAIEGEFAQIPVNGTAFKRAISAMRKELKAEDFHGRSAALLDKLEKHFGDNISDIASLKKFRTGLGAQLEQSATPAERQIINKMYGVLTRERNRSILRFEGHFPKRAGILKQLREADDIYRKALSQTTKALGVEGGKRETGRQAIGKYLNETAPERLVQQLFNSGDYEGLMRVKEAFPQQFEQLRQHAIKELVESSSANGVISPQRLITNLGKYGEEVQQLLMGDLTGKAKNVKTVLGALPRNFNPSDTATKQQFMRFGDWKDQGQMLLQRSLLHKKAPSADAATKAMSNRGSSARVIMRMAKTAGGEKFVEPLMKAAQRGPNSFATTYFLLQQSDPTFQQIIDREDDAE